ncbi:MAG TPA: hypothetical protein VK696_01575 [Steroidobacteraceae bacterium]|jgi:hypothetical protein|nr:hypothetical protein [Steroidobacteraceae bacterium]
MCLPRLVLGALLLSASLPALAQGSPAVSVFDNPGGGTIATAQMPAQHTVQGAMGRVLQYVRYRFGARPQVTRVLRGADGHTLAVIFTVKATQAGNQEIAGLALVAVSPSAPGRGAVLSDQADRFRTTVKPMLDRLFQRSGGAGAANSAQAANVSQMTSAAPVATATGTGPPANSHVTGPSHTSGSSAKAASLHQAPFPDNSGVMGLPEGWRITGAHAGEVTAVGPDNAALHYDWQFPAINLGPPAGRKTLAATGGQPAGNYDIPYGTDAATTFKSALTQFFQRQRTAIPSIEVISATQQSQYQGSTTYGIVANFGAAGGAGAARAWAQLSIWPLSPYGTYLITLNLIKFPEQVMDQSEATASAMFHSYLVNNSVAQTQLSNDHNQAQQAVNAQLAINRRQQETSDRQFANYQRQQDIQDRQFQSFDNDLLDRTVVRDSDLNEHGTVSNDLADALVQANPDRFQEVPASQYVKGIDY